MIFDPIPIQFKSVHTLTYCHICRKYGPMKTTITLRDDLLRRAKARAALRGQPLRKYMEESLERALKEDEKRTADVGEWIDRLPRVSEEAVRELESVVTAHDFRPIDPGMWR